MLVVFPLLFAVAFGRNATHCSPLLQEVQDFIRIVAFVGQQCFEFKIGEQWDCPRRVCFLTTAQYELYGVSEGIYESVDFCGQAPS
jgi:hypothetical protein